MDNTNSEFSFSLLYPDAKSHGSFTCDPSFINAIGADKIFGSAWSPNRLSVSDSFLQYMTCDRDVINYRLDLFGDILSDSELYGLLADALPALSDINDLRTMTRQTIGDESDSEKNIVVIKEIDIYTGFMERMYRGLEKINQKDNGSLEAVISPVEGIYTHFVLQSETVRGVSRFGDECIRLKNILEKITRYSLLLMDETLSGTSSFEGVYIAEDILKFISLTGCRCIFSTHLHELAKGIVELNTSIVGGVRIDNLTVGVDNNKKRNFKLTRHNPDGKSYAREIAEEFGLSLKHLMEKNNNK
ncbi:MAG: hypothetical protein AB9835_12430 [Eubacteriales bacterium]